MCLTTVVALLIQQFCVKTINSVFYSWNGYLFMQLYNLVCKINLFVMKKKMLGKSACTLCVRMNATIYVSFASAILLVS